MPNFGGAPRGHRTANNNDTPPSSCLPRERGSGPSATDSYSGRSMHLHLTPSGHDVAWPPYRSPHDLLAHRPFQQAWHHQRPQRLALRNAGPVLPPYSVFKYPRDLLDLHQIGKAWHIGNLRIQDPLKQPIRKANFFRAFHSISRHIRWWN